jgi:hypothetical protein
MALQHLLLPPPPPLWLPELPELLLALLLHLHLL